MAFKLLFDRDNLNLYPWYFADQCLTKDIEKIFNRKVSKVILEFKKSHIRNFIDVDELNEIGEYLLNRVIKDKSFYKLVEKNILATGEVLLDFCQNLPGNLKSLSNEELVVLYNEYAEKTKDMRAWGWVPPLIDGMEVYFLSDYLQEKFRVFLKGLGKEEKVAEYYSIMSSGDEMSEVQMEEIERLELIKKIQAMNLELIKNLEKPEALTLIRKHAKKFEWLTYSYIGPKMNEKDVINLIKNSLSSEKSIDEQIQNIKEHYKNLKNEKVKIISEVGLSEELIYLSGVSSFFMHIKDLRKGIYQKSYVAMDPVIEEIARRMSLTLEETKYLIEEEIKSGLIEGKDFSNIAKARTDYCVAVTENGETQVYQGEEAEEIIRKETVKEEIDTNIKEFKGSIAYAGKAKGIVKIILVPEDVPKLKPGEILVSSATNPDLIVAMKKASAFVTDTGGITSHASIVSRELKKPCVVGTKIATKVLKDGDLVEVDANSGIVKILKRAGH